MPCVFFGANSVTCVIAGKPSAVAEYPSRLSEWWVLIRIQRLYPILLAHVFDLAFGGDPSGRAREHAYRSQISPQGDGVRYGNGVGFHGSKSFTETLTSLPQQRQGVRGGTLRGTSIMISTVLLDEVSLKGSGDFIGRLQRVVDSQVP